VPAVVGAFNRENATSIENAKALNATCSAKFAAAPLVSWVFRSVVWSVEF